MSGRAFAGAIGILACIHTAAVAQTITLGRYGYWEAFGGAADGGQRVCGVILSGAEGRAFTVKWFDREPFLTVQVFKPSWHIPTGVSVEVSLRFDSTAPWTGKGITFPNGKGIEIEIRRNIGAFTSEMRYARAMELSFPGGTEGPWVGNMTGSNAAVTTMANCMHVMIAGNRTAPTQPYDDSASPDTGPSTQPFDPGRPHTRRAVPTATSPDDGNSI